MACTRCNIPSGRLKKLASCDGCRKKYCEGCSGLSMEEITYMQQDKRNLKYHCGDCLEFDTMRLLKTVTYDKDKIINMMDENIKKLNKDLPGDIERKNAKITSS
ncbi:hypothetical protein WA026_012738 [Henosepilachna vigintioctopunctata]|uniref:Uncharacterized protein n=1 Tax=Henosepilachna vigintioctopunctata TaxID=420089 RepID=A0AAW1U8N3_9CUCU